MSKKINVNGLDTEHLLYELLTQSVSTSECQHHLEMWFKGDHFDSKIQNDKVILQLRINHPLDKGDFKILLQYINNLGWSITAQYTFKDKWVKFDEDNFLTIQRDIIFLQLEANYPQREDKTDYKILYHVSRPCHREKITRVGLCPKNKEKILKHPARVYIAIDEKNVENIIYSISKATKGKEDHIIDFDIWEIDNEGLFTYNQYIRFYKDVNFKFGVFTLSNVPPKFLKLIKTVKVDDNGKIITI